MAWRERFWLWLASQFFRANLWAGAHCRSCDYVRRRLLRGGFEGCSGIRGHSGPHGCPYWEDL